jgi:UDP-3-O-[3-hydroxymyristoyl] glucosamine N-acyltransferase
MADPRFFTNSGSYTLKALAEKAGATLHSPASADYKVSDVAPLDQAGANTISFLDNVRYKDSFKITKAGACVVSPKMVEFAPAGIHLLVSDTPYKSYALIAQVFYPDAFPAPRIAASAHVHPTATIGKGAIIEEGAIIQENAQIGEGTWIEPNAIIGRGVVIGKGCRIGPHTSISHAVLGDAVRLYPGVRVGQDGFGFAPDPKGHVKVPQLGRVLIEDHVEIGANSCIDRGAGPDTVIGAGTWIDNLVQIGHNVKIGKGCILIAQSGVAGSTTLEDYAVIAAQAGIAGHLKIGMGARIGAKAGVMRDVPAGEEQLGAPAVPVKEFMRQVVALKRLTKSQKSE